MKRGSDDLDEKTYKMARIHVQEDKAPHLTVNQLKEPVHVFCRLKQLDADVESCIKLQSVTTLSLSGESKIVRKGSNHTFKHIFTSYASQREIFDHVAKPLLEDLIYGKNGLLFTYGVTGSGKTYTLTGEQANPGIIPRSINIIFNTIEECQAQKFLIKPDRLNGFEIQSEKEAFEERLQESKYNCKTKSSKKEGPYNNDGIKIPNFTGNNRYAVFISYIEIYNNNVFDLLDKVNGKTLQSKMVREDSQKNMYVNGIVELEVKSAVDAFELFYLGQKRKRMAHTNLNSESSRSHSIFNIRVAQLETAQNSMGQPMVPEGNLLKVGQLSLVDLAGTERCNRTQNTGARLKEASSINNSLMSLRTCLEILRENQLTGSNKLIPYRDSRLTLLFKNYFEGEGQIKMIVCVNPSNQDYGENIQVLKFAEMTRDVEVLKSEPKYTPYRKTNMTVKVNKKPKTRAMLKCKKMLPFSIAPVLFDKENSKNALILNNLCSLLQDKTEKNKLIKKQLIDEESLFRNRLVEINDNYVLNMVELKNVNAVIRKQTCNNQNLESRIVNLESTNSSLIKKNEELRKKIAELQNTVEEKTFKINRNLRECEKSKKKFMIQSQKFAHEQDKALRKQGEEWETFLKDKEAKINKVKEIIGNVPSAQSTPKKQEQQQAATPFRLLHRPNCDKTNRYRRSRSAGEIWLEHNVIKPVQLDTVFQPSMKKRKSITTLDNIKDVTRNKQSKYCLIAQEPQSDGELETQLYKADILPTCGGGAQVVFNDIEKLRHESPIKITKKF